MDLFDPKPALDKYHGETYLHKLHPEEINDPHQARGIMRSPFQFVRHGQSGISLSEVLPYLGRQVDDIALIRSMFTTSPVHPLAAAKFHTGRTISGFASLGAWVTYALGSENQNLPAFVVLDDPLGLPVDGTRGWQAGFLPPVYQGTRVRSTGSPILNLHPEQERPAEVVALQRDLLGDEHPALGTTLDSLARALTDVGEYESAEPLFRQCLAILEKRVPEGHRFRVSVNREYGHCLIGLGRYAEAEVILLPNYEWWRRERGANNRYALRAAQYLADLYDAWGKPQIAAEWRAKLAASEKDPESE